MRRRHDIFRDPVAAGMFAAALAIFVSFPVASAEEPPIGTYLCVGQGNEQGPPGAEPTRPRQTVLAFGPSGLFLERWHRERANYPRFKFGRPRKTWNRLLTQSAFGA
jgi:hypothetical protein